MYGVNSGTTLNLLRGALCMISVFLHELDGLESERVAK
jgi:hypothetical protein